MKIQIITLFPNMFPAVLGTSMMLKAEKVGGVDYSYIDLRKYGLGPRKQVDDTPYGGGDGMLLKVEPLYAAVEEAKSNDPSAIVYLMSPAGKRLNQKMSKQIAASSKGMIIVCAHYEGYDERVTKVVDKLVSIGDYVLTGGEPAAMVLIDSVVRLIPGVLGGETSAEIESFSDGVTLEFPQYTRPETFRGMKVPKVLLNGHHGEIAAWRKSHTKKSSG